MSGQFTARQKRLIRFCIKAQFGWAKYARSVKRQGYCTPKQEETLISMHQRIQSIRSSITARRLHDAEYNSDISDIEAMSFGEYF